MPKKAHSYLYFFLFSLQKTEHINVECVMNNKLNNVSAFTVLFSYTPRAGPFHCGVVVCS